LGFVPGLGDEELGVDCLEDLALDVKGRPGVIGDEDRAAHLSVHSASRSATRAAATSSALPGRSRSSDHCHCSRYSAVPTIPSLIATRSISCMNQSGSGTERARPFSRYTLTCAGMPRQERMR